MALEYNNSCAAPLLVNFAGAEILMTTLNMRTAKSRVQHRQIEQMIMLQYWGNRTLIAKWVQVATLTALSE